MQVKKQQWEYYMEQLTGSKLEQEYFKAVCCHPAYLYAEYIMWNAGQDESQAGIKIAERNTNKLRYADDTTLMAENEEELENLLIRMKEESENNGLKFKQLRSWHPVPSLWKVWLWAESYMGIHDLQRRGFWSRARDKAWSLKDFV